MNWITCSEQLPDERVLVLYLVRDDDEPRLGMRKKLGEQWYWCESAGFDGDYEHTVTHWLPIPALPQP